MLLTQALAILLVSLAAASPAPTATIDCTDAAHIIAARGTTTDWAHTDNLDGLSKITDYVQRNADGTVSVEGLDYPASGKAPCTPSEGYPSYKDSRTQGEELMKQLIQDRVDHCDAHANIVLLGFSQGAQVITDILSGGSDTGVSALEKKYVDQLSAVVLIADPAQIANATYNNKVDAPDGQKAAPGGGGGPFFSIPNPGKVAALGKRVIAYCAEGDKFCDYPGDPIDGQKIHGAEIGTWMQPAREFILSKI